MENLNAVITGVGGYVPDYVLTNDEISKVSDCSTTSCVFDFLLRCTPL